MQGFYIQDILHSVGVVAVRPKAIGSRRLHICYVCDGVEISEEGLQAYLASEASNVMEYFSDMYSD